MKTFYSVFVLILCVFFFSCKKNSIVNDTGSDTDTLKEGLIAYYPFNGNAMDESGNGNNLNVNGATLDENRFGDSQKAYKFNGISDYMIIPKILEADSLRELSISVWVKVELLGHSSILSFLAGKNGTCSSYLGFDNSTDNFATWHQMVTVATPFNCTATIIKDKIDNPLDKWSHIVLVQQYDANNMSGRYSYTSYYNGKKINTEITAFDVNTIAASFSKGGMIGANNNSGNYNFNFDYFNGYIDDIRIYNRALSDNEVSQLYLLKE